ncbi:hypothetical protein FHX82_003487 [Amycolatopsis bartoniae]|nr:hypothetical protein [Amycolatopsis bartoniae]
MRELATEPSSTTPADVVALPRLAASVEEAA